MCTRSGCQLYLSLRSIKKRQTMVTKRHASRLRATSTLTVASVAAAIAAGQTTAALATGAVLVTSLSYWSNPCPGVRKNADLATVAVAGCYMCSLAASSPAAPLFYALYTAAGVSYIAGRGRSWAYHGALHLLTNVANVVVLHTLRARL